MSKPKYGIDSPGVVWSFFIYGILSLACGIFFYLYLEDKHSILSKVLFWVLIPNACLMFTEAILMIRSSVKGKPSLYPKLIEALALGKESTVLDLGCGSGQLLAQLAPNVQRAVGIDLWRSKDQSDNKEEKTAKNLEGINNVELVTGDMQKLPFEEGRFDAVVASFSLHNIDERMGRERALIEADRVLKPGGRIAILDIQRIYKYAETLRHLKYNEIEISDRQFATFPPSRILTAQKPPLL